jgi:hypothetical protein
MPHPIVNGFRQMPFAGHVLDQDNLSCTDDTSLTVAGSQLDGGVEVDDVLSARGRMLRAVMRRLGPTENDAMGFFKDGGFPFRPFLRPIDGNVSPVRLAVGVAIEIVNMNPHQPSPYMFCQFGLRFSAKAFGPSM